MLGTWMQMVAQGWVVTGLTSSALTLGLINFASGVPMLAFSVWGGVAADRMDKRRILLVTQVVQIVTAVAIGWLIARGMINVWHIVIAGVFLGISAAFEMPAAAALIPELVPRESLRSAIAVDRSVFHATRLAGPALAGVLIGWLGTSSAFFANAASFVAMIVALLTLPARVLGSAEEEAQRQTGMKEGWNYVRSDRPTRLMIMLLATVTTCISPFFMLLMPLFSRNILHIPAAQHGLLMASSGIGSFAGSLWLLRIQAAHRMQYMRWAIVGMVIAMGALSQSRNIYEAVPSMIILTVGTATLFGVANTIVQERAPDTLRGRVSALFGMSFFGILPFSGILISEFSDLVGLRAAMGISILVFGAVSAFLLYRHHCAAEPVPDAAPTAG
jgi:MFS family permease